MKEVNPVVSSALVSRGDTTVYRASSNAHSDLRVRDGMSVAETLPIFDKSMESCMAR